VEVVVAEFKALRSRERPWQIWRQCGPRHN